MINPTGHKVHLNLDREDEPDELDLVYSDLEKAQLNIKFLKDLCLQAADALEEEFGPPTDPAYGVKGPIHQLIAELRKAAE